MPRSVRNFWLAGRADGSAQHAFGPRSRNGGAFLRVSQRAGGEVCEAFTITSTVPYSYGALETEVSNPVCEFPATVATSRRDAGETFTRYHFRGGFTDTLAEALRIACDTYTVTATREAQRGNAEESETFALRAAECSRILAEYFPKCVGGTR